MSVAVLLFSLSVLVEVPTDTRYVCTGPDGVVAGDDSITVARDACKAAAETAPGTKFQLTRTEVITAVDEPGEWLVSPHWGDDRQPMYACDQQCLETGEWGELIGKSDPALVGRCEGPIGLDEWQFHTNSEGIRGLTSCLFGVAEAPPADGCDSVSTLCVGAEFPTIQAAVDAARPGDTVCLDGVYEHPVGTARSFVKVTQSGTADAPITIEPCAGKTAHLVGWGFPEDGRLPTMSNERLIDVWADHIHVKNIEFSRSTRFGLVLGGNHGLASGVVSHDNWESGIYVIGNSGEGIRGNRVEWTETYRNRHGSGVAIHVSNSTPRFVADTTVENNIAYKNGWLPDGTKSPVVPGDPAGGGNSDGFVSSKFCHTMAPDLGMDNACPRTVWRNNITWRNADDGFDQSVGSGSVIENNISMWNGPEGNKGFKGLNPVLGGVAWIGNLSIGNRSNGMEFRFAGDGKAAHNASLGNGLHGIYVASGDERVSVVNNVSYGNAGIRDVSVASGIVHAGNWMGRSEGNPGFVSDLFDGDIVLPAGTVRERWASARVQVKELVRMEDSRLVGAGLNGADIGPEIVREVN